MFRRGLSEEGYMDAEKTTLLNAIWNTDGNAESVTDEIRARLESGSLVLTGNFKGREAELTAEAGDWEKR
jgi:hypothetical protein